MDNESRPLPYVIDSCALALQRKHNVWSCVKTAQTRFCHLRRGPSVGSSVETLQLKLEQSLTKTQSFEL